MLLHKAQMNCSTTTLTFMASIIEHVLNMYGVALFGVPCGIYLITNLCEM